MSEFAAIKKAADDEAALAPAKDRDRVRAEYLGAAIADSCFCQSCGARGFIDLCPSCH